MRRIIPRLQSLRLVRGRFAAAGDDDDRRLRRDGIFQAKLFTSIISNLEQAARIDPTRRKGAAPLLLTLT